GAAEAPRDPVAGGGDQRTQGRRDRARDYRDHRGAALIYPTRTAVVVTAAGAPVALAVAAVAPGRWFLALALPLAIVPLYALQSLRGAASAPAYLDFLGFA